MNRRLERRGRLSALPMGSAVDRVWRRANRVLVVRGNVSVGVGLRAGAGTAIWSAHGLTIGDHCAFGSRSVVQADGRIGHFLMTGPGAYIVGRADHAIDELGTPMLFAAWIAERRQASSDTVDIGDDVWLGAAAIVLGGVTIGTGCVIGAGSVVARDLPAFSVAVGNPARVVSERFTPDERDAHLAGLARWRLSLRLGES